MNNKKVIERPHPHGRKLSWALTMVLCLALVMSLNHRWKMMNGDFIRHPLQVAGAPLNWPDDLNSIFDRLKSEPEVLLSLVTNNTGIQEWLASAGRIHQIHFTPDQRASIAAQALANEGTKRVALMSLLRSDGAEGLKTLASLFRYDQSLSFELGKFNRRWFSGEDAEAARFLLLDIAFDEAAHSTNRIAAVELIGHGRSDAEKLIPSLKQLSKQEPGLFSQVVRIAVSRIQNTPDLLRLRYDMNWLKQTEPFDLKYYLRDLTVKGESAREMGPEVVKELRPFANEAGAFAAITLALIDYRESVPHLIVALQEQDDWFFVLAAVEALGRMRAKEAIGPLMALTEEHWHSAVRKAANDAISAIHGKYHYEFSYVDAYNTKIRPPQDEPRYHRMERTWWQSFKRSPIYDKLEELRVSLVRVTSPYIHHVRYQFEQGIDFKIPENEEFQFTFLPRHRISFHNGLILGYDQGEFGAGVAYVPNQGTPIFFPTDAVVQLFRWNNEVIVRTARHWGDNGGILYFMRLNDVGAPLLVPFKRLPYSMPIVGTEPDGSLLLKEGLDSLKITPHGEMQFDDSPLRVIFHP